MCQVKIQSTVQPESEFSDDELIQHTFSPSDDGPEPWCTVCAEHGYTTIIGDHRPVGLTVSQIWFQSFAELMAGAAIHFDAWVIA